MDIDGKEIYGNSYADLLHHFGNLKGDENNLKDMLQYIWGLQKFHKNFKLDNEISFKDDDSSTKMRKLGNEHFYNKDLDKALSYYNDCIINAVQPVKNENSESSITLSLGFGNRSTILFEMQLYDLCLADIRRAFLQNYPIKLHQKLIIREIKCHFAKYDIYAATSTYERYVSDDKYSQDAKLLETLKKIMSDCKKELTLKKKNEELKEIPSFEIPQNIKYNKQFPSVSDALEFTISSEKGRGFIAKKDIMPGEVLMKEKAYSACLFTSRLLTHCSYCLRRIEFAPLPCTSCTSVIFCDEKCKLMADKLFHKLECLILPTLGNMDYMYGSLPLRIICQTGVKHFLEQYTEYKKECLTVTKSEIGFNSEGVYQSEDLLTIFNLATNIHLKS